MLLQGNNCEFSQLVCVHGKAFLAGNGCSLAKRNNAVRGRRQADPKGVAVPSRSRVTVLAKGVTIAFALRLAAERHSNAESVIITLKEHYAFTNMSQLLADFREDIERWRDENRTT